MNIKLSEPVPLTVDYNQTVENLVAAGKFMWSHQDITSKNFPSTQKGKVQTAVILMAADGTLSSNSILQEMTNQRLRPATLRELLTLYVTRPELAKGNVIGAIGSVWRDSTGHNVFPYIMGGAANQALRLCKLEVDFPPPWIFTAVHK